MSDVSDDASYRFGGISRLFGADALALLQQSHVVVIGLGGVGSWAAEALARSAVGRLTLIDWDDICVTNVNRQSHALDGTLGQAKVEIMQQRIGDINAACQVSVRREYCTEANLDALLADGSDFVLDAIDDAKIKCLLIHYCRQQGLPILTVGGAGGRIDSTMVRVDDLSRSCNDPLLARVRKRLRVKFGFPRDPRKRFRVDCVYSPEEIRYPQADGSVGCQRPTAQTAMRLDCAAGYGAASFVTGSFGFAAAGRIVQRLLHRARLSCEPSD